jgi:hypothetical protein
VLGNSIESSPDTLCILSHIESISLSLSLSHTHTHTRARAIKFPCSEGNVGVNFRKEPNFVCPPPPEVYVTATYKLSYVSLIRL